MEVHDPLTGLDYVADHVYQRGVDGAIDLEVTLVQGKGVDSIAHAGQDGGWVQVGVERTEFQRDEVLQRVDDFAAESLFQVPLDLATRGIECVPEELRDRLEFGGGATDPPGQNTGQAREQATPLVVRAVDGDGQEQVRMVFDPQTSLLLEASFRSVAGWITYRFGEYREVSDGLWLPTARSYLRNEVLLSALTAVTFEVLTASVLDPQEQPEPDVASEKITP
jgi:hypothetical protein